MPTDPRDVAAQRELLREASAELVRTADGLAEAELRADSRLPGWTRAHVLAHLALNAEGLAGALRGVVAGEPVPMYASQQARNVDIEELAAAEPAVIRERLLAGVTEFDEAAGAVPDDAWDSRIERTPGGGRSFRAGSAVLMRLREVVVHHADLDAGFDHRDWPDDVAVLVLRSMARREPGGRPFTAVATDTGATVDYGGGGPAVRGTLRDLAWWTTGRGGGEGLTSDEGELPRIEAW